MSTEYFHGYHWKEGRALRGTIDKSVWLENEEAYRKEDFTVYIYLMRDEKDSAIYKIGISNYPKMRCKYLNTDIKSLFHEKHIFEIHSKFFVGDRKIAESLESVLLVHTTNKQVYKRAVFPGATEIRLLEESEVKLIIASIKKIIKNNLINRPHVIYSLKVT